MDRKNLENFIKSLYQDIYSFSFAMVPDELQARQMALDGVNIFLTRNKDFIEETLYSPHHEAPTRMHQLKRFYFAQIFSLGIKRFDQLKGGLDLKVDREDGSFYAMGVHERAVIFLKMVLKFDINDIEAITAHTRYEILSYLAKAREYLLKGHTGRSLPSPIIPGNE